ncbi:hypothetical protein BKA70DRAFT_1268556, partial [Coprinopsis sp. MPI-PUGE-AT-0042]
MSRRIFTTPGLAPVQPSDLEREQARIEKDFESRLMRKAGDALFDDGKITDAINYYWMVVKAIFTIDNDDGRGMMNIPSLDGPEGTMVKKKYQALPPIMLVQLVGVYTGLIRCYLKQKDIETALMWFEEMEAMWHNYHLSAPKLMYDYMNYNMDLPEVSYQRVMAWTSLSDALLNDLGNTALAFWYRWRAMSNFVNLSEEHQTPGVKRLNDMGKIHELMLLRHPDPHVYAKYSVTNERLQINGSWRRIRHRAPPEANKMKRYGFSCFIWNSCLYVGGGGGEVRGPFYRDLWCLDLNRPTLGGWRKLPGYTMPSTSNLWLGWVFSLDPYTKRAYLFNGLRDVDYFDLVTERWGSHQVFLHRHTRRHEGRGEEWMAVPRFSDLRLYFTDSSVRWDAQGHKRGCNLFMELDLKTKTWRRISGTVIPPKDAEHSCPGPRKYAASWVDLEQKHFYLLYGSFDRDLAKRDDAHHASDIPWTCPDCWVYDIDAEKWTRERIRGNSPPPRTEFGLTFNPHLNKVFLFGGYSASFTTSAPQKYRQYDFAYFADTFMLDLDLSEYPITVPSSPSHDSPPPDALQIKHAKWRQVLTPGFPTYRCHCQLLTDRDTGKMYMIGGFTNDDWMSENHEFTRTSFGDLWQLRVNLPGGWYSDVNVEDEWKTARAGPWKRCFTCGSAGLWKRCGGSCGGKAFFCDNECLKEGWKGHKAMHKCGKK